MDDNDDKGDFMDSKFKKIIKGSVVLISLLQIVACGSGRQNVTGVSNPVGVAGAPGTLDQKVRAVLNTFRCANGAPHVLTVLRFNSIFPNSVGTRITSIALNEAGAKQVAVGIQQDRNVVVVKDYGHAMDAFFYMCNLTGWGANVPNNNLFLQSATLITELQTTSMNPRCNFTQIAMFNVLLHLPGGFPVEFAFFPVDALGTVPLVCEADPYGSGVGGGFGWGNGVDYGNGNNYGYYP
jgi:hypothetical protein